MVNLSRTTRRGLAGIAALTGLAVVAPTGAQATPTADAGTRPVPVVGHTAESGVDEHEHEHAAPTAKAGLTGPAALKIVRYNKLYKTGPIPASRCKEVNVSMRTVAGVNQYSTQLYKCLYAAWKPILAQAGARSTAAPKLHITTARTANTRCGVVSLSRAFYCENNIYFPANVIVSMWKQNSTYARVYATNTMAHEYGHHIQEATGIMDASWWRQRAMKTNTAKMEESRRRELQASCLGSAYIGANRRFYPMTGVLYNEWRWLVNHSGDQKGYPRDHGSYANHGWWSEHGFYATSSTTTSARCNTYESAPARVS
ncbi:neutral zinc metallopeptidase [Kribbella sp. NPDC056345]|uniref:neutral zinc metallopeptidase n=1 Tax=Kribbella sp. NPDC056345 TaxID=3345789 RepID=UPI0035DC398D